MAKTLSYTSDISLSPFTESYWVVAQVNFCPLDNSGQILFYGYATQEDYEGGSQSIGQRSYTLTNDKVTAFLQGANLKITDLLAPVYVYAAAITDMDSGQKDNSGQSIMKSFFDGAITVDDDG